MNGNEKVRDKIPNYSRINSNLKFVDVCLLPGKNILLHENKIFKLYSYSLQFKKKDDARSEVIKLNI